MTPSLRWVGFAIFAALVLAASDASALHTSLAELLTRKTASDNSQALLSLDKLEGCALRARTLDRTGNELDMQMEAIQEATGRAMFLQYLNRAQLPRLDDGEDAARADFEQRTMQHDVLRRKLDAEVPVFEKRQAAYEADQKAFDRDCAGSFTPRDLDAIKAKLNIK